MHTRTDFTPQPLFVHLQRLARRRSFTAWLALGLILFSLPLALAQDVLVGLAANGGPEGRGTAFSLKANNTGFTVLKGFADWGQGPEGNLVQASDGNYYGMTPAGGTHKAGTIFRVTPDGAIKVLHHFVNTTDGGYPRGGLTQGPDGALYGLTNTGGPNNYGTIFRITTAGVFTMLKSMAPSTEGGNPYENLMFNPTDGCFYGTNYNGGAYGYGTIFKYHPATKVYTTLYSFNTATGRNPEGSLVKASDGNLYGTTVNGGTNGIGTIFRFNPSTKVYSVVRHLQTTDGYYPKGSLTVGNDGHLYGVTYQGGTNSIGTVFRVTTAGSFSAFYHFKWGTDGGYPDCTLAKDPSGNLYGITGFSGANGYGTIFKVTTGGQFTVLRAMSLAADGGYAEGSLIRSSDGNLYGMAAQGGVAGSGTIFRIGTTGGTTFKVLVNLHDNAQGNFPKGTLVQGKDGAFYGTNSESGKNKYGTLFKICGGVTTVLRHFQSSDGAYPLGSLMQATDGNLYGTTSAHGNYGYGTIFQYNPTTNVYTAIHHFVSSTQGGNPKGGLVQGADGLLYGTTSGGGSKGNGTIFKFNPSTKILSVIRHLDYSADGAYPTGDLVRANDGNFYGTLPQGSRIYRVTPDGAFSIIKTMSFYTEGANPYGGLVQGNDNYLYGMASMGGTNSVGTVFKIKLDGSGMTVLRHLNASTDGSYPKGSLVKGTDGMLYGMTPTGGANKAGTLFKVGSTNTSFFVMRHFNLTTDGGSPEGSLIVARPNLLVANAQAVTTTEDVAKAITLTGSGDLSLSYNIISGPRNGTLSGTGSARTYTPKANFNGSDSFTFVVTKGCIASAPATVTITVSSVNDAPVLATITNKTVVKGKLLTFTATATDADAGQTRTFSLVTPPSGATIGSTTGNFSWTPMTTGTYTLTVKVTDNGSPVLSSQKSFTVTVTSTTARVASADGDGFEEATLTNARLFPNPVVGSLTVQLDGAAQQVESTVITDATGKTHLTDAHRVQSENELGIDVSGLKEGLYLLRLQTPQGSHTLRFLKK